MLANLEIFTPIIDKIMIVVFIILGFAGLDLILSIVTKLVRFLIKALILLLLAAGALQLFFNFIM